MHFYLTLTQKTDVLLFGLLVHFLCSSVISLLTGIVIFFQDNVFVNVVASIQYRAVADNASDAFYKLSNTKGQIQAYVFDGIDTAFNFVFLVTIKEDSALFN